MPGVADPGVVTAVAAFLLVPVGVVVARRHLAIGRAVLLVSVLLVTVAVVLFVIAPST